MARGKEAARRCGNTERAIARPGRTQQESIAREYERWTRIAGIVIGAMFGVMFALGLIAG